MTNLVSTSTAYMILCVYALVMLSTVWVGAKIGINRRESFFVADRKLSIFRGAASIAVSWIWAPAVFFAGMKAFTQGIPGAFWFIVPNVICFFTFVLVAKRMRDEYNDFVSLPDYFTKKFQGKSGSHLAVLSVTTVIGIVALLFNVFIGAFLLKLLSGINLNAGMAIMMGLALAYSIWKGFPASVVTDVIQLTAILVIALLIVPWCVIEAGGLVSIAKGFGGNTGEITNIFDSKVVFSFGIPATIALLAVPLADQMFYQRVAAVPRENMVATFVLGGIMFGAVPILLSIPGFVGAGLELGGELQRTGFPDLLISVDVVKQLLPEAVLALFFVLAICALSSTIDSALVALGLIWGNDIYARYINQKATDEIVVRSTKIATLVIGVGVIVVAWFLAPWLNGDILFNFNGTVASTIVGPLLLTVFWKRMKPLSLTISVGVGLFVGIPLSLWANYGFYSTGNDDMANYVVFVAVAVPLFTTTLAYLHSIWTKIGAR